ncbi:MAG: type I restriction-modification enzyme R subunit C-terminal domain-containing protein [Chthoniobacterales bacterium]
MHLEPVEHFQRIAAWTKLTSTDCEILDREVAGLPSQMEHDDIESRFFDLLALQMQLALIENEVATFEQRRLRVTEIAALLEEKTAIPAVAAELAYLTALQKGSFWEGVTLDQLDEMRLRMRRLVPFLDRKKRKVIYADFQDEVKGVRVESPLVAPKMTGTLYARKVEEYLKTHLDHIAIQKLRQNQPLTPTDLSSLEEILVEIGEDKGSDLLAGLLEHSEAPSLPYLVRKMVGMDREAAKAAFSTYLNDKSLTGQQIRFVELMIDQLTARGVMEPSALYEPPFSNLNDGGPDAIFAGRDKIITGIFTDLDNAQTGLAGPADHPSGEAFG